MNLKIIRGIQVVMLLIAIGIMGIVIFYNPYPTRLERIYE
jgi:hypothetical protein